MSKTLDINSAAKIFKALSDQNRLAIVLELANGEKNASSLLRGYNIAQPTMSHHLAILCDSGIISARRNGKSVMYSLDSENAAAIFAFIGEMLNPQNTPIITKSEKPPKTVNAPVKETPILQTPISAPQENEPENKAPSRVVDFFD